MKINSRKILIGLSLIALLGAGCDNSSTSSSQVSNKNCETDKAQIVTYLSSMDSKTKSTTQDLIYNKSDVQEIFYSPKLKECVYIAITNKTFKTGPITLYTLRDSATGSVLLPAGTIYPDRSDKEARIKAFNNSVKQYR